MSTKKPDQQKLSGVSIFIIAIFTGTILYSGFLGWQQYSLTQSKEKLTQAIEKKDEAIKQFAQYDKIQEKHNAQEILQKAENYRIEWSQVLDKLLALENKNLEIKSFSVSKDKKVSLNASARSYESIALLIETLKLDPQYTNPFVAGFSGTEQNNQKTYNFTITFLYTGTL